MKKSAKNDKIKTSTPEVTAITSDVVLYKKDGFQAFFDKKDLHLWEALYGKEFFENPDFHRLTVGRRRRENVSYYPDRGIIVKPRTLEQAIIKIRDRAEKSVKFLETEIREELGKFNPSNVKDLEFDIEDLEVSFQLDETPTQVKLRSATSKEYKAFFGGNKPSAKEISSAKKILLSAGYKITASEKK